MILDLDKLQSQGEDLKIILNGTIFAAHGFCSSINVNMNPTPVNSVSFHGQTMLMPSALTTSTSVSLDLILDYFSPQGPVSTSKKFKAKAKTKSGKLVGDSDDDDQLECDPFIPINQTALTKKEVNDYFTEKQYIY